MDQDKMSLQDLKRDLEDKKDSVVISTMKAVLTQMINGDTLNGLLMHVIRFVMPSKNKQLKKLCVLYWEICQKRNDDGSPRQEMVLVCNALRNDLLHPNEFIRGQTLRYLCKLKEEDILEPLVPAVRTCLDHKHPYVRKNAVLALSAISKIHSYLVPDAVDLIRNFLIKETDQSAMRNGVMMLMNIDLKVAVEYYHKMKSAIPNYEQGMQLAFIEVIRRDCKTENVDKTPYIQTILSLLEVQAPTVRYEAANTLVYLSSHTSAIQAAAKCYIAVACQESDNNVKLIVLDRIDELRKRKGNERVLDGLVMDVMRVGQSKGVVVKKKSLEIVLGMMTKRNVREVVEVLKKEIGNEDVAETPEYRKVVIGMLHEIAKRFPSVANDVVEVVMEFLTEEDKTAAIDVIAFVKEVVERFPDLRSGITKSLLEALPEMTSGRSIRGALWILGEYAVDTALIEQALKVIKLVLGPLPIVNEEDIVKEEVVSSRARKVLADGTYATESAFSSLLSPTTSKNRKRPLRALVLSGDFYVMTVLSTTLTKLSLRYSNLNPNSEKCNEIKGEAMLIMTCIVRTGRSDRIDTKIDEDSYSRIITCIRVLSAEKEEKSMEQSFLNDTRAAFGKLIREKDVMQTSKSDLKNQVDDVISYRLLKKRKDIEDISDLSRATGTSEEESYVSKLDRIFPLTGYSDPVYVEAYINILGFDIILDILVINQTKDTLQNLTIEFSSLGDLKLMEKATVQSVAGHSFASLKVNFKVSSTENGVIFGNLVYDTAIINSFNCVTLNEIQADIMDYIKPKDCNEMQFRKMWDEFEWENKIKVVTKVTDLSDYLQFILKTTHMKCLTTLRETQCGFLAANLYAQSIFGEDALANVSLELTDDVISGHIRIRSKTQGIALALGEKISNLQKSLKNKVKEAEVERIEQ